MGLFNKNCFVFLEEVFSLHSWLPWLTTYEDYDISILKHFFSFVSVLDLYQHKNTDLRGVKLQSSSSSATPFKTLTAGVISSNLR